MSIILTWPRSHTGDQSLGYVTLKVRASFFLPLMGKQLLRLRLPSFLPVPFLIRQQLKPHQARTRCCSAATMATRDSERKTVFFCRVHAPTGVREREKRIEASVKISDCCSVQGSPQGWGVATWIQNVLKHSHLQSTPSILPRRNLLHMIFFIILKSFRHIKKQRYDEQLCTNYITINTKLFPFFSLLSGNFSTEFGVYLLQCVSVLLLHMYVFTADTLHWLGQNFM